MIDPKKLEEARLKAGLNRSQLSLRAGLSRNHVHRLEGGTRGAAIPATTLNALAEVLKVEPESLLVDPEEIPTPTPRAKASVPDTPPAEPDPEAWRWG